MFVVVYVEADNFILIFFIHCGVVGLWSDPNFFQNWKAGLLRSLLWKSRTHCQRNCATLWYSGHSVLYLSLLEKSGHRLGVFSYSHTASFSVTERDFTLRPGHVSPHGDYQLCHQCQYCFYCSAGQLAHCKVIYLHWVCLMHRLMFFLYY